MDSLELLGSTLGLGFLAGIRLYATVLALGLGIRFGWLHLPDSLENLRVLADPVVLVLAAAMFLAELVSDKIPWVDSVWDSFHTVVRPVGAIVLAATAIGGVSPTFKAALILLCGAVAFTSHSSKAATRMVVNYSPEPFSTIGLSLVGDVLVPLGVWLTLRHPILTLTLVLIFLVVFAWLSAKVFRLVRLQVTALRALLHGHFPCNPGPVALPPGCRPEAAEAFGIVARHARPIPPGPARALHEHIGACDAPAGIRCAATKKIDGLRNSIGFLAITSDELAFVTRRLFRYRVHRIPVNCVLQATLKHGLLMNRLVLETTGGERVFYLFKTLDIRRAA